LRCAPARMPTIGSRCLVAEVVEGTVHRLLVNAMLASAGWVFDD
jgi:hypothetical protein